MNIDDGFLLRQGLSRARFEEAMLHIELKAALARERLGRLWEKLDLTSYDAYVGHSGGKDSVTICNLVDTTLPGNDLLRIHTPKPEATHPDTVTFLYALHKPVLYCPAEEHSRIGVRVQIDGTRIFEHDRRDGRSTDVMIDGRSMSREHLPLYVKHGLFGLSFIYPIYDWTDADVWAYIVANNIPFSKEYLTNDTNADSGTACRR